MKKILAVALVTLVASIALSQDRGGFTPFGGFGGRAGVAGVAGGGGLNMEYKVSDRGGFEPGAWEKKLNDLAKEGWELVTVDEGHYILRRYAVKAVAPVAVPAAPRNYFAARFFKMHHYPQPCLPRSGVRDC